MNRQIKVGIVLQYLQMGLSVLISLLYTPFMLRILGSSEYGLYNLASSIISYLSLFSLGIGGSYLRFYFLKRKENPDDIKNLNGIYLILFLFLGLIALLCGFVLAQNVSIFFNNSYSSSDLEIAKKLMIFLALNLALAFPMSLFSSYIMSQERFVFSKLLNIIKTVLSPTLSIIALFFGYGSIGLVAVTTIISVIVDIINIYYCFARLKMKFSFRHFDFNVVKDIFVFSFFIALNQIIDQINWQTDKIILGKMLNSIAVSIYAIGSLLNNHFIQFSTAISSVFAPKVNKIVQSDSVDKDRQLSLLMSNVGRIQFMVLSLILSGFVFFGQFFIKIWAGDDYYLSYYVALLLMCPEIVPLIQNIGLEIQRAKNKHKFRSIVYLIMAFINVSISIILCSYYGVIGTAVGTTISLIIANGFIMNIYYHKCLNLDMKYFWFEIIKLSRFVLVPIIFGIIYLLFIPKNTILFIVFVVLYVLVFCVSLYLFGLKHEDKNYIKSKLHFGKWFRKKL